MQYTLYMYIFSYAFAPVNTEELSHDPGDYEGDEDDDTLYEKITLGMTQ